MEIEQLRRSIARSGRGSEWTLCVCVCDTYIHTCHASLLTPAVYSYQRVVQSCVSLFPSLSVSCGHSEVVPHGWHV